MNRNPIRTRIGKGWNISVGILDHQVAIQRQLGRFSQRFDQLRPQRDVRHKVAVHHIDVNDSAAAFRCPVHLLAQTREIRR